MGLDGGFLKAPETIKFSVKVICPVGKLGIALAQCHQPLRLGDKKPPRGFAAALGPVSNEKLLSEFQTIAFEFSLWKMTYISLFCAFCLCVIFFCFVFSKELKLFLICLFIYKLKI